MHKLTFFSLWETQIAPRIDLEREANPARLRRHEIAGGSIEYVGEWHSHPDGYSTNPSDDDRKVFHWIDEHLSIGGLPPMLIVGNGSPLDGDSGRKRGCMEVSKLKPEL